MHSIPPIAQPILNRLELISAYWSEFVAATDAHICIWELSGNDSAMVNAFLYKESSEDGETDELFLTFESAFESTETYPMMLLDEWHRMLGKNQIAMADHGVLVGNVAQKDHKRSPHLVDLLHEFAGQIPRLESFLVLVLSPQSLASFPAWLKAGAGMARRVAQQQLHRVRLMIMVPQDEEGLHRKYLDQYFANYAMRIEPKINMAAAIEQMATTGDPSQLDVKFRTLFVKMHNALLEKEYNKFFTLAEQAKTLIEGQDDWLAPRTAIEISIGGAHAKSKNNEAAFDAYREAEKSARELIEQGHAKLLIKDQTEEESDTVPRVPKKSGQELIKEGTTLLCQVLIGMGTAAFTLNDYAGAAEKFVEVIPHAQEIDHPVLEFEAKRMLATATLKGKLESNYKTQVWKLLYEDILLKAKGLKEEARKLKEKFEEENQERSESIGNEQVMFNDREKGCLVFNHTDGPLPLVGVMLMDFARIELKKGRSFLNRLREEINGILRPGWEQIGKIE